MTEEHGNESCDNVERSNLEPKESLKGESISSTKQNTDHKKVIEQQRSRPESFKSFSDGMPAINPLVLEDSLTGDVLYNAGNREVGGYNRTNATEESGTDASGRSSADAAELSDNNTSDDSTGFPNPFDSKADVILNVAQNQKPPEKGMMLIGGQWYRPDQLVAVNIESGFPGQAMRTVSDASAVDGGGAETGDKSADSKLDFVRKLLPEGASMKVVSHPGNNPPFGYSFENTSVQKMREIVNVLDNYIYNDGQPTSLYKSLDRHAREHSGEPLVSDGHQKTMAKALMELKQHIPPGGELKLRLNSDRTGVTWDWKGFDRPQADSFIVAVKEIPNAEQALLEWARGNSTFSSPIRRIPETVAEPTALSPPSQSELPTKVNESPPVDQASSEREGIKHSSGQPFKLGVEQTRIEQSTSVDQPSYRYKVRAENTESINEYLSGSGYVPWNGRQVLIEVSPDAITPVSAQALDGTPMGVSIRDLAGEGPMSASKMFGRLSTINGVRFFVVDTVETKSEVRFPISPTKIPLRPEARRSQTDVWKYD